MPITVLVNNFSTSKLYCSFSDLRRTSHWSVCYPKPPGGGRLTILTVNVIELALMMWPGVRKWDSRRWSDRRYLDPNGINIPKHNQAPGSVEINDCHIKFKLATYSFSLGSQLESRLHTQTCYILKQQNFSLCFSNILHLHCVHTVGFFFVVCWSHLSQLSCVAIITWHLSHLSLTWSSSAQSSLLSVTLVFA